MDMRVYLKNRPNFPLDELAKHRGEFIALSSDGKRIVAASEDFLKLDDLIRAAGEDPAECMIEGIPDVDTIC